MMTIKVVSPGLLTTLQDSGRQGYRHRGIPTGGALDIWSMRIANMLVGNEEDEAVLELTVAGPIFCFRNDATIAICGADLAPTIDNQPVPLWRPVRVRAESVLEFGYVRQGCRAYLALAGGFDRDALYASRNTSDASELTGVQKPPLSSGDILHQRKELTSDSASQTAIQWYVDSGFLFPRTSNPVVRVIHGPEFGAFTAGSQERLFSEGYAITPDSNRMGYRLAGSPLELEIPFDMVTEGVAPGTIQVPPQGSPILLMADCQTTGGYPRIANVISVDLPVVAQLKPGDILRFAEISVQEAQQLYLERERSLQALKQAIALRRQW